MADPYRSKLDELENRIAVLEARLQHAPGSVARAPKPDLEIAVGLTWLNRIGAGLVIVGLAFAVAWANDRGHLSPLTRNGLLALVSLAVLAIGGRMLAHGDRLRRTFAVGLSGVGAFGLFLAPFTASRVDSILEPSAAAALVIALTLALSIVGFARELPSLVSLGLLGALSIPLAADGAITGYGGPALALAVYVASGQTRHRLALIDHVAVLMAAVAGAAIAYERSGWPWAPALAGLVALGAAALLTRQRGDRRATQLLFVVAVLFAGVGLLLAIASRAEPSAQRAVLVSCALVGYGLTLVIVGANSASQLCRVLGIIALGIAVAKLGTHDMWHLRAGVRVAGFFVLGVGLLVASYLYSRLARQRAESARYQDSQRSW